MDTFVSSFMLRIASKVPAEVLGTLQQELVLHCEGYDITEQSRDVIVYQDTLPEAMKMYIVTKKIEGKAEGTLELYHNYLSDFFFQVGKPITDITANDIRLYLYNVQNKRQVSNATLDARRSIIKTFFGWAAAEGHIPFNPATNIQAIKYTRKPREALTDMELEKLRAACKDVRTRAIVEFLYSTACRISEVCRLNIADIDYDHKCCTVLGKGNKYRTVYLNAKAILALKTYLDTRTDDNPALFVSDRRPYGRLQKAAMERVFRKLNQMSGINRRIYPHLMRHTTATHALNHGMEITQIQTMLGHSNVATTMIYATQSAANVAAAHNKFIN